MFGKNGRLKCPQVWQPDNLPAKIIYSTEKSGLKEEIVPTANHFDLEIKHFNDAILAYETQKIDLHSLIWVRYDGEVELLKKQKIENTNSQILPDKTQIINYKDRLVRNDKNGKRLVQYIQTTTGRILFNQKIQRT